MGIVAVPRASPKRLALGYVLPGFQPKNRAFGSNLSSKKFHIQLIPCTLRRFALALRQLEEFALGAGHFVGAGGTVGGTFPLVGADAFEDTVGDG